MSFAKKKLTYIQLSGTLACNIPCGVEREHCYGSVWKAVILDVHIFWEKISTSKLKGVFPKGHSFCKQCLHDLQFMKTRSFSPDLSKLARADISCQFMKTRSLCRHCLQNEWTLGLVFPNKKLQQNFNQHESLKGYRKVWTQTFQTLISFSCVFLFVDCGRDYWMDL